MGSRVNGRPRGGLRRHQHPTYPTLGPIGGPGPCGPGATWSRQFFPHASQFFKPKSTDEKWSFGKSRIHNFFGPWRKFPSFAATPRGGGQGGELARWDQKNFSTNFPKRSVRVFSDFNDFLEFSRVSGLGSQGGGLSETPGGRGGLTCAPPPASSIDPILPSSESLPHSQSSMLHSLPIDNQTNSLQVGSSGRGTPILAPSLELATSSNLPTRPKALDLFSGTGSVGDRLRELGYDVVSLDIDPNRRPTIVTNVLAWEYAKDFPRDIFR